METDQDGAWCAGAELGGKLAMEPAGTRGFI